MAKIDITRTELVWPGKYNEDGTRKEVPRVSLPFQVIETVNESRATREAKKVGTQVTLFDGKEGDTFEGGWKNKLIWGDNPQLEESSYTLYRSVGLPIQYLPHERSREIRRLVVK
jgi:adenine-specific DNA-methyltransferase